MSVWKLNEDPWIRHARCSPQCQYLILQRGQDYVTSVTEQYGAVQAPSAENRINVSGRANAGITVEFFSTNPRFYHSVFFKYDKAMRK